MYKWVFQATISKKRDDKITQFKIEIMVYADTITEATTKAKKQINTIVLFYEAEKVALYLTKVIEPRSKEEHA